MELKPNKLDEEARMSQEALIVTALAVMALVFGGSLALIVGGSDDAASHEADRPDPDRW